MSGFLKKHVIFTAIVSTMIYIAIVTVLGTFMPNEKANAMYLNGDPSLDLLISDIKRIVCILLFTLPAMLFLKTFSKTGLRTTKGIGKGLMLGSGVILLSWGVIAYSSADNINAGITVGVFRLGDFKYAGIGLTLLVVVSCLLIGIMEETLCRGIIFLNMLDKWGASRKGLWKAILLSALPFGLLHLLNLTKTVNGAGIIDVAFQVVYATTYAVFAAVLYLRCRNMWVLILNHAIIDLAQYTLFLIIPSNKLYELEQMGNAASNNLIASCIYYSIFVLGFLIAALIMFRKVTPDKESVNMAVG